MTTTEAPPVIEEQPGLGPPDIARQPATASALPPRYYTDPEVYKLEEERIFRKQWMFVGREDEVAQPGDYLTIDIAGTPLIIVRDQQGTIRALSGSCLHRYMPVVEGSGNRTSFQCPYHLWTYGLDGQLIGAPEMEHATGFDKSQCRLPEARLEVWEGFLFVNLDPQAQPLSPQLEPLSRKLAGYHLAEMRTAAFVDYDSDWDWKVMVENALESYHHAGIHRDTLEPLFPARYTSHEDVEGPYVYHHIPTRDRVPVPAQFPVPDDLPDEQRRELLVVGVFPTLILALQPGEMNCFTATPIAHQRHRVRFYFCVHPGAFDDPDFETKVSFSKQLIDTIHRQDMKACADVQRGLGSTFAAPGRLSHLEKGVWQFDEWVLDQLREGTRANA
jgi:phenylpropionate dioxygenase-like ring-hydroxylating dioxygenase large terminal subunit